LDVSAVADGGAQVIWPDEGSADTAAVFERSVGEAAVETGVDGVVGANMEAVARGVREEEVVGVVVVAAVGNRS
jgi:hypothetical protein